MFCNNNNNCLQNRSRTSFFWYLCFYWFFKIHTNNTRIDSKLQKISMIGLKKGINIPWTGWADANYRIIRRNYSNFWLKTNAQHMPIYIGKNQPGLSEIINIFRKLHKTNIFGMPPKCYHRVMYIAPSSGHILLNLNLPLNWFYRGLRLFSDAWSENYAALFERMMEIHSNPPILS